ncbi:MAG: D-alanyl-D-alanine carboxypeptidase [Rhodospirillales bacterium]|nr:D-alanyl-D-alanine carboxypeptidase [Rhodospirillales bacterium]
MESPFFLDTGNRRRLLSDSLKQFETRGCPIVTASATTSRAPLFVRIVATIALVFAANVLSAVLAPAAQARYASIVVDFETGKVLNEQGADERRHPASLTKMMTLYLIFEALDQKQITLDTRWNVSAHAAGQAPTKLGLEEGDRIRVRDVILGLVTRSANDAAAVAAEGLAGSEPRFAELMTRRARQIGMGSTNFVNASGLPADAQITTARDMATLGRELIRRFPHHYHYFQTAEFVYEGRTFPNHNRLMRWYEGADGIKTGYIRASGFNLVASAMRDGRRIVGAVIGGPNPTERDQHMGKLLDAGFSRSADLPAVRVAQAKVPAKAAKSKTTKVAEAKAAPKGGKREVGGQAIHKAEPAEWAVQVGAFNQRTQARKAAEEAQRVAGTPVAEAEIQILGPASRARSAATHRARLTGLTQAQARAACRVLDAKDMDCMIVGPGSEKRTARSVASAG